MNVEKAIKIAEKLGCDAEVFIEEGRILQIEFLGDGRKMLELSSFSRAAVRVLKDGLLGYSSFSSGEDAEEAVRRALKNAKMHVSFSFPASSRVRDVRGIFDERISAFDHQLAEEKMKELLDSSTSSISKPTYASISFGVFSRRLVNSFGCDFRENSTSVYTELEVVSREGGPTSSSFQSASSRDLSISFEEIGRRAREKAEKSLKSSKIPSGTYPVVFHPDALSELLEHTLLVALNGYSVLKGRSPLAGKLNEVVANEEISLYDSGVLEGGVSSSSFDDEGVPCRETPLILKGELVSFYHDLLTSSELEAQSTGNGFRESCESPVRPSSTNVLVRASSSSEPPESYLYVNDLIGAHTSNPVTGDFAVEGKNCIFIDGSSEKGISSCMLSGNIYDLLLSFEAVGEEKQSHNFYMPELLTSAVKVIS